MNPPFVLRPVNEDDLPQLRELVGSIAGGMTSLPDHPSYLEQRIHDSMRSFDHRVSKPGGETYLFVLVDTRSGRLCGTSGLLARVGGFDPFYTYRITRHVQSYEPLEIVNELRTLDLIKNHKGPSETCSLFLHPDYRSHGLGKLLSLSRFLFIKAHPKRFDSEILAELRGYIGEDGLSPFWEAVGKKFFQKDYYTADVLSGIGEKDFIEALLPAFPIYVELLPYSAQEVIGRVHPHTEPAKRILLNEGFHETDEVDIFDAGPLLRARIEELKTWRGAHRKQVADVRSSLAAPQRALVSNLSLEFRATVANIEIQDEAGISLSEETADALRVRKGDSLQYLVLPEK